MFTTSHLHKEPVAISSAQGAAPALPNKHLARPLCTRLATALATLACVAACGDDPDPVVVVDAGEEPQILEWTQAFAAEEIGWLMNVWGPAPDNLYAVGGAPTAGRVMHFDGQGWAPIDLELDVPLLNWTYGFGSDDITIVGNGGTIIHWNGTDWTLQETPTTEDLWGIWGASPDDLWAVGGRGREPGQETILHYDGDTWTNAPMPDIVRAGVHAFFKIWGTSADNIYIVGQNGVVLHYDGSQWTEEFAGANDDLISLWGTGPDRIVAVGGRGSGIVSVWNGQEWTTRSLAPLPGLNGVWMNSDGTAYAVGQIGVTVVLNGDTLEYEEVFAATDLDLHSVFSADGVTLTGVGGNLPVVQGPYMGIAYRAMIGGEE